MKTEVGKGKYVIAVSGGVDSVVLLDLLVKQAKSQDIELIIAHFDHGIRERSASDRRFAAHLAEKYGLEFFYEEGNLGPNTSEAVAREKRYKFLNKIKEDNKAKAIITAHHQDDLIETAAINIIRGTGRKGLSSLSNHSELLRPLLMYSKAEILDYASQNKLQWREDETNTDQTYLRNFVRHTLLKDLSDVQKHRLLGIIRQSGVRNEEIDNMLDELFLRDGELSRSEFNRLGHEVAKEVVTGWLRKHGISSDKQAIDKIVTGLKTAKDGKKIEVSSTQYFILQKGIIRMNNGGAV
ncbi:MAG TPA: tRNA lysidine(34) synthetase TilS [Patescibacteria group bacterium]|nr:tRNA lysidine(34) synthetase TilS [Patescibacteria group bacterium]